MPYNDRIDYKKTKQSAKRVIPWFSRTFKKEGQSVCDGRWVAIHYKGKICCAQWADVGPFGTDDWAYVFGGSRPKNRKNDGAGIDLSPAVRDFLGITGKDNRCDWRFAELHEIPYGPWRKFGSTGVGSGERGLELAIFSSDSVLGPWEKKKSFTKKELQNGNDEVVSIEGASLLMRPTGVELFLSTEKDRSYPNYD